MLNTYVCTNQLGVTVNLPVATALLTYVHKLSITYKKTSSFKRKFI